MPNVQHRVIAAIKPLQETTRSERVESVISQFHELILKHAEQVAAAAQVGIVTQGPPDVYAKVIMPNVTTFQPDDNEDPVMHVLGVANSLFFMATNTLIFAAQAIATRGPAYGPTAEVISGFAKMSNENMAIFISSVMSPDRDTSTGLLDAHGKPIVH